MLLPKADGMGEGAWGALARPGWDGPVERLAGAANLCYQLQEWPAPGTSPGVVERSATISPGASTNSALAQVWQWCWPYGRGGELKAFGGWSVHGRLGELDQAREIFFHCALRWFRRQEPPPEYYPRTWSGPPAEHWPRCG